ncbi:hypothetical protein [Methylobacterium oxalidis]|uniref:Type II secretion system protein GspC N-terminal domain-containing protein n=1 Tax=Methylobacterium oxalidis TaxID=944322 RepID=A0A512IZH5_9HYPH|nr:hypothetical protein [Methylobacterium oxalidis]GEP03106.1 hypothetical protein MOX02_11440 [Methylobacterium oxalidis]GJE31733.1 hypothetical protein LDDCCGHA_1913 [Methylobacterium oxalidis]GLS67365.1 hypothetical protein GCM10007888_57490 [Methylobacterium oxalidis]
MNREHAARLSGLAAALGATGRVPRALAAGAALAALAAGLWPVDGSAPAEPRAPELVAAPAAAQAALARPLFDPGRRAWTARGSLDDVTGAPAPEIRLRVVGILLDGTSRRALVDDGSGPPVWLAEGEGRGSWRILSIAPDRVAVADGVGTRTAEFLGEPVPVRPERRARAADAGLRPALGTSSP